MTHAQFIAEQAGGYGMGELGDVGMGALCPSVDQLNGVVNPNDPCQGLPRTAGSDYQTVTTPQGDYQIINGIVFDPQGKPVAGANPFVQSSGLSPNVALWGLVAIAAILLIGGGGRKH